MTTSSSDVSDHDPTAGLATGETETYQDASGRNIARWERVASILLGGALVQRGLRRRSLRGIAMAVAGSALMYRGIRGHSPTYQSLGIGAGEDTRRQAGASDEATAATGSVTVERSAEELDEFWRQATEVNRLVGEAATVVDAGDDRQRWTVDLPVGGSRSWEMRLVEDEPGEYMRWESTEDAPVSAEWSIRFRDAPGDRGTEVRLEARFDPPAGALGNTLLDRLGFVPRTLVRKALHRFKSLAETGEVPTLDRNPSARGSGDLL